MKTLTIPFLAMALAVSPASAVDLSTTPDQAEAEYRQFIAQEIPARKDMSAEDQLIEVFWSLNSKCRGRGDDPYTWEFCKHRDALGYALNANGLCLGTKADKTNAEQVWHSCGPDSYRYGD